MSDSGDFAVDTDDLATDASTWTDVGASVQRGIDAISSVLDVPVGGTGGPGYLAGLETAYEKVARDLESLMRQGRESIAEVSEALSDAAVLYEEAEREAEALTFIYEA